MLPTPFLASNAIAQFNSTTRKSSPISPKAAVVRSATVLFPLHLCLAPHRAFRVLRPYGWDQVDEEGEHIEREDECDGPLQDRGSVVFVLEVASAECDLRVERSVSGFRRFEMIPCAELQAQSRPRK